MTQIITSRGGGQGGGGGGDGDMKKAVYDPQNIGKDAFDYDNFTNTPTIPTDTSDLTNNAGFITSAALSGYQTTSNLVTNLTNPDDTHYPSAKAVSDAITSSGGGDMLKSVYDPNNVSANAFDYDNFINTPTIPTNSDYVDLSTNQTVGGTKTFTTSPVVPSKSTDATNTATAISTEAQVYKKQDKLTTQTAYTSKGTASKVPQITTNSLGQVTGITEVSISYPSQVNDTAYGSSWDGVTTTAPSKNAVYDKINSIDGLIPSAATSSNKLTDKNYVDDSINSVTAYYITKNAAGDQFANYAELAAATTFYSGGVVRVPTRNDYTIVLDDENHSHATTRYIYNSSWEYQYTINETPLTTAQINALNSGITSTKVGQYDTAVTTIGGYGDIVTHDASEFATSAQGGLADTALQPNDNISELVNDAGYLTTAPVTSVNGQTGAVTISEGNTKTFYASTSSQWNTTLGQQVYDWISSGNYAILQYGIQNVAIFTPTNTTTGNIYSQAYYTVRDNGNELESVATTYGITVSSGTVTAVSSNPTVSTVGNFFAPGGTATTGYVVTKTASGYEWAAPSGGDVMVSSQANNILTSGMKIWAGTQSNYDNLGTYDNNTVYLTI